MPSTYTQLEAQTQTLSRLSGKPLFCSESALPNPASVVLGSSDDGITLVVEGTRKDLVDVTFQNLQALP